ncbi:MAG: tetratricopeptide repeat protein, partial [Myxococcota bacterium]
MVAQLPFPQLSERSVLVLLAAGLLVSFVGCPRSNEPDTLRLPLLTTDNPDAEADIRAAREAFEAGNAAEAVRRYEAFLVRHPTDPLVAIAQLSLGQIHLAEGRLDEAAAAFDQVTTHPDASVAERGRFYNGVLAHLHGEHRRAIEALRPFVGQTVDPVETSLLLRTLARASQAEGDVLGALAALDQLIVAPVPVEDRDEAREAAALIVESASPEDVDRAVTDLPQDGAVWPSVAERALRQQYEAGNLSRVHALAEALEAQGATLEEELQAMALRASQTQQANPRTIGAILPLSGRGQEVGQLALKGLMLRAQGPTPGPAASDAPEIVFRDDGGDPARAVRAVEELVT